jgi:hypothetical protein
MQQVNKTKFDFINLIFNIDIKQLIEKGKELTQLFNTRLLTDIIKNKEQNQVREIHSWACKFNHFLTLIFY